MKMKMFPVGLMLLVLAMQHAHSQNTYSIIMPKYLRPGFAIDMVTQILQSTNPVKIQANLNSHDNSFTTSLESTVAQGQSEVLTFPEMIPVSYKGSHDFSLVITGFDNVTNAKLFQNSSDLLEFTSKAFSIFIQSDKAIYQRSQTMKFRAVVTKPDLLPLDANVTYKLEDPDSNIVLMEEDVPLVRGVVGSEFPLNRYATLGEWKLTYEVHGFGESLMLTVEEYTLPKFEVKISFDQGFLHSGSEQLSGKISAKFTFGQPVKGSARLNLSIERPMFYYYHDSYELREIIRKFSDFDGEASFDIPVSLIRDELKWNKGSYSSMKLKVTAYVTDKNSLSELNATTTIDLMNQRFKVEKIAAPENAKPGLPYKAYVKLSEQDGTLVSQADIEEFNLSVDVQFTYPYVHSTNWQPAPTKTHNVLLSPGSAGIAVLDIFAPNDNFTSINCNCKSTQKDYVNKYLSSWNSARFKSPSDIYLQISNSKTSFSVGDEASFVVYVSSKNVSSYAIMITARGKLVKAEAYTPPSYTEGEGYSQFVYSFYITAQMSPSVSLTISHAIPKGEIVADSVKLNVQPSLLNKVSIITSTNKTDTGTPVEITVRADENSLVALRGIDQSVLLLKKGNDITPKKVFEDLDRYSPQYQDHYAWSPFFFGCFMPIQGGNVPSVFKNSGFLVFTDAEVFLEQSVDDFDLYPEIMFNEAVAEDEIRYAYKGVSLYAGNGDEEVSQNTPDKPKVRKEFPETWLWTQAVAGENGTVVFRYNTPDTITSWELSSFAVSPETGLGATEENSKITVFRNFFISVKLPPTMIRGETLYMRVTIYNFFEINLDNVEVTLEESEWYELQTSGNGSAAGGSVRSLAVPGQDGITTVYPIKLKKAGMARISIKAISELAGDAVEKALVVKPEGIKKEVSESFVIDITSADTSVVETLSVIVPSTAVPDSARISLAVTGNVLSNALNNLGNLLQMPYGCGEQNMLNFAPDVFISTYLKKTGRFDGETATKAMAHIRQGYVNELRYQRKDGSFSAFGQSDDKGSTWLTAFVMKCFIAASRLDASVVEKKKVSHALEFLLKQQADDSHFKEMGRVLHYSMKGGVQSDVTMTAYVLIAMAEGGFFVDNSSVTGAVDKAKTYLENNLPTTPHSLAVVAYALAIAESEKLGDVLDDLESKAVTEDGMKYWSNNDKKGIAHCEKRGAECPYSEDKASASDVETTAYVLLTLLWSGRMYDKMPIIKWLIKQRGPTGGYSSTQDTVMAIQALATYAAHADRERNINIRVTHTQDASFSLNFQVTNENSLVYQTAELPSSVGDVMFTASGVGFADVQLNVEYNVPAQPRMIEPFIINYSVRKKDSGNVILSICTKNNKSNKEVVESTGMFVITASLSSGFTVNDRVANEKNLKAKLVELEGNEVSAYFDELPPDDSLCAEFTLQKFAEVEGIQPRQIRSFNYYLPDRQASVMYQPKESRSEEVCGVCPDCEGCSAATRNVYLHFLTFLTLILTLFLLNP